MQQRRGPHHAAAGLIDAFLFAAWQTRTALCYTYLTRRAMRAPPLTQVAGSTGITPMKANKALKPSGFPTSVDCNIARFNST